MFKPVSPKLNVNEMEESVLKFWNDEKIFEKSTENRKGGKEYIFFEGPPTANGKPGVHHVLARSFKDVILRRELILWLKRISLVRTGVLSKPPPVPERCFPLTSAERKKENKLKILTVPLEL